MIHTPDSLCYKVFKTRFFPDCSILEAKDSTIGSYAWKSILSARDVIKKGLVWWVGIGKSMCIREDKWLRDQICKSMMIPPPSLPPNAKVSLLIDPESATWKADQVQQLFTPHEAKLILSIPLSGRLPPDHLIWSQMPTGVFTTRSAYQLLANSAMANSASSSNPNPQKRKLQSCAQFGRIASRIQAGILLRLSWVKKEIMWYAFNNLTPLFFSFCNLIVTMGGSF